MTTSDKPRVSPLTAFLSRSGYSAEDVLVHNPNTRVFVTSNGGKYQLGKSGIRILKGPQYPKFVPED